MLKIGSFSVTRDFAPADEPESSFDEAEHLAGGFSEFARRAKERIEKEKKLEE